LLELRAVETPLVDTTALPITAKPHKFDYETEHRTQKSIYPRFFYGDGQKERPKKEIP
jgi:hypothetical protein